MDQAKLWRHFQGESRHIFEASSPRLDFLLRKVQGIAGAPSAAVLNIGAGNGYFEGRAQAAGMRIASLDPDADTAARLRGQGIDAVAGSITAMPFDAARFDAVVASEVLEHLTPDEAQAALREIARVLRPGGVFVGTVPFNERLEDNEAFCPHCGESFHRWGHRQSFSAEGIRSLLSLTLAVESCSTRSFVSFRGRGARGLAKSLFKWVLGRMGEPVADPHLLFIARRA